MDAWLLILANALLGHLGEDAGTVLASVVPSPRSLSGEDSEFSQVITAQQARAYKPSLKIFELALRRIGVPAHQVLHVGQSLYHDVLPAQALGLATVWVNRPSARQGVGPVKMAKANPDLEVRSLAELACASAQSRP